MTRDEFQKKVEALATTGDARAIGQLIAILWGPNTSEERTMAMQALTRIDPCWMKSEAARNALPEVLARALDSRGSCASERARALRTLELIDPQLGSTSKTKASVPLLVIALTNTDFITRMLAARALGEIGDVAALEPLSFALRDREFSVRQAADTAMNKIDPQWRARPGVGAAAVLASQKAAKDNAPEDRRAALEMLGKTGGNEAIEELILALKDEDRWVRSTAIDSLGRVKNERAVTPLVAMLSQVDHRQSAAFALERIGSRKAIPDLVVALTYENPLDIHGHITEALTKALYGIDSHWWMTDEAQTGVDSLVAIIREPSSSSWQTTSVPQPLGATRVLLMIAELGCKKAAAAWESLKRDGNNWVKTVLEKRGKYGP